MNDAPETFVEQTALPPRRPGRARMTSAGLREAAACAEGEVLKQQYDSSLAEWRKQSQPLVHAFREGEASTPRALQLREEALTKRNAAANRMYLHRATCSICRRRR
jgi:hypothetical protein